MVLRCAVLDDYQAVALQSADWSDLQQRVRIDVFHDHVADEDRLARRLADYEIVVAMRERTPFPAALLARLPALRLLVTTGMRNSAIDIAAARGQGVMVCGTPGSPHGTPELTWALILGLSRNLGAETAAFRQGGPWQSSLGNELFGRRLGVIGLGHIGTRVARVALALGMTVEAWSKNLTESQCAEVGVAHAGSLRALIERCDIATIHLKLSERTIGLIGHAELVCFRPHAFLVNTSRAAIVDGPALLAALDAGTLRGYGTDVYEVEPLPNDHALRVLPNVYATPHLGYVTQEAYREFYGGAVESISAWLSGAPIRVLDSPA